MPFTTVQNTPIDIDLVAQSVTTGWTAVSAYVAAHDSCNTGSMYLIPPTGITLTVGVTYLITFQIDSISGGYVQPFMGTTAGTQYTTTGFKSFTIVCAGSSPRFRFLSNATCQIEIFNIQDTTTVTTAKQQNNIIYSEKNNKWSDFRTYVPDFAFGFFENMYPIKAGNLYVMARGSTARNGFFGTQYTSILNVPFNASPSEVHTFQAVSVQSNQLMITTADGVTTSLGQISELIAEDFTKSTLTDGATTITVNTIEGVYSAPLMRDKNVDIISGPVLKGNWMTIEVVTTASTPLKLFSIGIHSEKSYIGSR